MSSDWLAQLYGAKYINLETYRESGEAVQTPVWFVISNDTVYVATPPTTGKVRRLERNKRVRIAPCNFKGETRGDWVGATAYFASQSETEQAIALRKKKYGLMARLIGMAVYRKGAPVVIGIRA